MAVAFTGITAATDIGGGAAEDTGSGCNGGNTGLGFVVVCCGGCCCCAVGALLAGCEEAATVVGGGAGAVATSFC